MNRFIRMLNMQGIFIRIRIYRDRFDAKLLAGAHDANGDLTAIGNQDLFEHVHSKFWMKYITALTNRPVKKYR